MQFLSITQVGKSNCVSKACIERMISVITSLRNSLFVILVCKGIFSKRALFRKLLEVSLTNVYIFLREQ